METISVSWKDTDEGLKRVSKMITDHERFVNEVRRTSGQGLQGIRNEYKSFEVGFLRGIARKPHPTLLNRCHRFG